ncbi:poly-beta-1,6-N-acetyl-D-glucosamine N-deacetylase PgaB [Actinobacillus equuli]|uniref:poly-beta-1,6-N-acetyl-D-glucosamine N-deacetylase PgaB n=1 Tax=Actinobacillus equuli TaxID=718 RepID=UPI00244135D2|nr:poly-beta-1,6-N-acetyl-D-glucosamine N-deacetylase PgaB [Actinobacillus equuli]WGE48064.1 poly-beta-1,6-N-acetyl-D-glucosamine N-deacetylase PgaB [Actinobacillus equuli subsp. equuli]
MILKKLGQTLAVCFSLFFAKAFAADTYSVLAYHSVVDESAPKDKRLYVSQTITVQQLISHFNWFKAQGYNVVSWQQVMDAEQGKTTLPPKAVLISFDDGYETMYSVIYPLLKAYNYPAVFAPVSSWIDTPMGGKIQYGNEKLDRAKYFATWQQIDEMQKSGLVEIASHTHDLHHGVKANPGGSQLAAMIAPEYKNGKYETEAQYKSRLLNDMKMSVNLIKKHTGKAPRVMVWPYGAFNDAAIELAKQAGMPYHFTLKEKVNHVGDTHIGRFLIDAESNFAVIADYLNRTQDTENESTVQRELHINLDHVYSPDPAVFKANYDALISRVAQYGVTAVYLKAYSAPDKDGIIDGVYFPNPYLPVKADIFSQVAWQLRTRAGVKIYAWMPASIESLPSHVRNADVMKSLYKNLSLYSKGDGLFFDSKIGKDKWSSNDAASIEFTKELKTAAEPYLFFGTRHQKLSRNINPVGKDFSQDLVNFSKEYDRVLIDARPYSLGGVTTAVQAKDWLKDIAHIVKDSGVSSKKVLFDFSIVNPKTSKNVSTKELISWIKVLEHNGIMSFGYYPNRYLFDETVLKELKPYVSSNRDITRK